MDVAESMPSVQPALRPPPCTDTLRHLFAARPHAARTLFSQRRFPRPMRPAPITPDKPKPARVSPTGYILAALALCLTAATGCSNIQSQAANVEGVRLYQQGNYQQASDRFQQAI